jgi:hypothetical protein
MWLNTEIFVNIILIYDFVINLKAENVDKKNSYQHKPILYWYFPLIKMFNSLFYYKFIGGFYIIQCNKYLTKYIVFTLLI